MSRNFEMLQRAERNKDLFRIPVPLPPLPAAQPMPEQQEPEMQAAEEFIKEERVPEAPSDNGHHRAVASAFWRGMPFRWLASFRAEIRRLGIHSNGHVHNDRGRLDLKNMASQEATKLVQRVFFSPDTDSKKVIAFFGVESEDGSASVCARMAETLAAQVQSSVCIVDANLHSPSLHHYFHARNIRGFSEALFEGGPIGNYAQRVATRNLWMITCGATKPNFQIPLNPDRVRARFEELRAQFDYVLINAPSMGMTADLTLLGQLTDGVIFVVEEHSTRRETAQQLKESLKEANVQVLGVVLNNRTFPIPESVYRRL